MEFDFAWLRKICEATHLFLCWFDGIWVDNEGNEEGSLAAFTSAPYKHSIRHPWFVAAKGGLSLYALGQPKSWASVYGDSHFGVTTLVQMLIIRTFSLSVAISFKLVHTVISPSRQICRARSK